jgi:hypothetical protein
VTPSAASGAPVRVLSLAALSEPAPVKPTRKRKPATVTPFVQRVTEADYQSRVTDYAERRKWAWVHFRPGRTAKGWRTPVSGPIGEGWPDLILVRPPRLVILELKSARGRPSAAQKAVLALLGQVPGIEVMLAGPADWDRVMELLR